MVEQRWRVKTEWRKRLVHTHCPRRPTLGRTAPPYLAAANMPAATAAAPADESPTLNAGFADVGTSIFTVMSALAAQHGAINLGQVRSRV